MSGEAEISLANVSQLATIFGIGRATVRSHIEKAGLKKQNTGIDQKLYKIREVAQAIYSSRSFAGDDGEINLNALKPSELRDYWMAQQKEMDYKIQIREYISAAEVRKDYKQLQDSLKEKIQSFPDILERDEGLKPTEVEKIINLCDRLMRVLHEAWSE